MRNVLKGFGAAGAIGIVLVLGACGDTTSTVDGKATVQVPGSSVPCYFLEIDRDSASGEELEEGYVCVEKAEWDANHVGEEYVDANGNTK